MFKNYKIMKDAHFAIVKELFYALTVPLAVLALLELAFPRMVLAYINLNVLLLIWLIIAIVSLRIRKKTIE